MLTFSAIVWIKNNTFSLYAADYLICIFGGPFPGWLPESSAKFVSWLSVPSVHMLLIGAGLSAHMLPPQKMDTSSFVYKILVQSAFIISFIIFVHVAVKLKWIIYFREGWHEFPTLIWPHQRQIGAWTSLPPSKSSQKGRCSPEALWSYLSF